MSIQLASTDVIQVLLDAAPATNQLPVNVSYVDQGGSGNNLPSITSGTTPVTIVGSPASGVERLVSQISIPNADTATRTVTVNLVRSSVASRLCKITLQAGYALYYDGKWMVLDPNGNFLCDVTVTGGTLTSNQGTPAALANAWPVEVTDGTNVLGTSTHPIRVDPTGTTTQPVSITNFPGVQVVNLTQVASSTLTSPSNYGTAPTGTVIGVNAFITNLPATQPISGSVSVTNFPATQPVSGTVTANAGTGTFTVSDSNFIAQASTTIGQKGLLMQGAVTTAAPSYTNAQTSPISLTTAGAVRVDASATTQPVSGTFWQATQPVSLASLPALATGSNVIGSVNQNGIWTVQPGNTANTTAWLVTGTGGIFPASQSGGWTVTSNQGTSPWTVQGDTASGASNAGNPVKIGGAFNTTQPTVTSGQTVDAQMTARGAVIVSTGADTFNITVNAALPAGSNTIGAVTQASGPWTFNLTQVDGTVLGAPTTYGMAPTGVVIGVNAFVTNLALAQGSTTSGQTGALVQGAVTTSAPTYTTAQTSPLSLDTSGALRISDSGVSQSLMTNNLSTVGTTNFGTSAAKFLNLIIVTYASYTSSGSFTVTIEDGSGNTLYSFVTGTIGTSTTIYNYLNMAPLRIPMSNGGNAPKIVTSGTAPSTGYIALTLGWQ